MQWEGDLQMEILYNAPDAVVANVIKSLLQSAGICAMVVPHASPWSGHPNMRAVDGEGGFAYIVVKADDALAGRELIQSYESADLPDNAYTQDGETAETGIGGEESDC